MDVRHIPLAEIGEPELLRWRRLAGTALEPNPFFEPEYLLAQARALDGLDELTLAVVTDGDAWAACLPLRRSGSWHRIPIASMSTYRGRPALPSLLGTPLIATESAPAAAAALVERWSPATQRISPRSIGSWTTARRIRCWATQSSRTNRARSSSSASNAPS